MKLVGNTSTQCLAFLLLFCSCGSGLAHVKTPKGIELAPALRGREHLVATKLANASGTRAAHIEDSEAQSELGSSIYSKKSCLNILFVLCFFCCCSGLLRECLGPQLAGALGLGASVGMFTYLVMNGTYSAALSGAPVGNACIIVCIWCFLQMSCLACLLCFLCTFLTGALLIKNEMIKKMREDYEEKVKHLSGPRQEYYESEVFKSKCNAIFEKADTDKSGVLDMSELKVVIEDWCTAHGDDGKGSVLLTPLLAEAFDDNHSSQVEKDEFTEMMKFLSVQLFQEGKVTEEQAFEILQLPETATKADIRKAYKKLALKWHPDKRFGVDKDVAAKDMGEINDAKAKLDELFKNKGDDESLH